MKIKITTDSVADLTKEQYLQNDIKVFPLYVQLGDKEGRDGETVCPQDIYEYVSLNKKLPKTSAVSYTEYLEEFGKILNDGYDAIIHFSLSSEMSVSYQNALSASKELNNVFVIDSKSLSTGVGLLVLYACKLKNENKTAEEIYNACLAKVNNVQASFIVSRLDYLHKGGRCSSLALLGANLLRIKPSIQVKNGSMGMAKKYMGKFNKCIENYVMDTLKEFNNYEDDVIFITHTKIDEEYVNQVKELLKQNTTFKNIIETTAGSTITSHCGEGTLGILYFTKN